MIRRYPHKDRQRAEIVRHTQTYIALGGKIQYIPIGVSGVKELPKKVHITLGKIVTGKTYQFLTKMKAEGKTREQILNIIDSPKLYSKAKQQYMKHLVKQIWE